MRFLLVFQRNNIIKRQLEPTKQTLGFGTAARASNLVGFWVLTLWNKQRGMLKDDKKMKKQQLKLLYLPHFNHFWWENRGGKTTFIYWTSQRHINYFLSFPFSPLSLKAIILELIFMAQGEIMGILSNVEMYVFLLVNQNRPYFKLVRGVKIPYICGPTFSLLLFPPSKVTSHHLKKKKEKINLIILYYQDFKKKMREVRVFWALLRSVFVCVLGK